MQMPAELEGQLALRLRRKEKGCYIHNSFNSALYDELRSLSQNRHYASDPRRSPNFGITCEMGSLEKDRNLLEQKH